MPPDHMAMMTLKPMATPMGTLRIRKTASEIKVKIIAVSIQYSPLI
jgi:hypothetical protein